MWLATRSRFTVHTLMGIRIERAHRDLPAPLDVLAAVAPFSDAASDRVALSG